MPARAVITPSLLLFLFLCSATKLERKPELCCSCPSLLLVAKAWTALNTVLYDLVTVFLDHATTHFTRGACVYQAQQEILSKRAGKQQTH